jgi:hypothetical protein
VEWTELSFDCMQCGDLISKAVDRRVAHKGTKYLGHEILLIRPEGRISMRLSTYILVCNIQKLFIYEDLWSHRTLDIYYVAIMSGRIKGRACPAPARGANL